MGRFEYGTDSPKAGIQCITENALYRSFRGTFLIECMIVFVQPAEVEISETGKKANLTTVVSHETPKDETTKLPTVQLAMFNTIQSKQNQ